MFGKKESPSDLIDKHVGIILKHHTHLDLDTGEIVNYAVTKFEGSKDLLSFVIDDFIIWDELSTLEGMRIEIFKYRDGSNKKVISDPSKDNNHEEE